MIHANLCEIADSAFEAFGLGNFSALWFCIMRWREASRSSSSVSYSLGRWTYGLPLATVRHDAEMEKLREAYEKEIERSDTRLWHEKSRHESDYLEQLKNIQIIGDNVKCHYPFPSSTSDLEFVPITIPSFTFGAVEEKGEDK